MKFNKIFKKKYSGWADLEKEIELLNTKKEEGDAFEL